MRRRLSLADVVAGAWSLVIVAGLLLPSISKSDPPLVARVLYIVFIPAGLLALPVAVAGSLALVCRRWLGRPGTGEAADYDDAVAAEPGAAADPRRQDGSGGV